MSTNPKHPQIRRLWTPHPVQNAIMSDPTRFRVVAAGRRFGKTEMADHEISEYAISVPNKNVWWVAPTYEDANELGYDNVKEIIPADLIESTSKRFPRRINLHNGTTISFRSADREDSLRGRGVHYAVIDEAGSIPNHSWYDELRPAFTDTLGHALIIGTPKGRNWFHDVYVRGMDDSSYPDYNSWHATTYDNPHVPDEEVEEQRHAMPQRAFKQEYLAEFLDDAGGVFRDVRANIAERSDGENYPPGEWFENPPQAFDGPYTIGVDLARTQNYAVTIALDSRGRVAAFERETGVSWTKIQKTIEGVASRLNPHTCYIDASRDNKIVQDLQDAGVTIEPVKFSNENKRDMVETLATRLEQGEITYPEIPALVNELQVYEYSATPSGNVRYAAPEGHHDDCVDALMLAARTPSQNTRYVGTW